MTERKRGIFYRKSTAFLHFHEDPTGIFADVKVGAQYIRVPATTLAERRKVLSFVKQSLKTLDHV